ncbi:MAG: glycosyltransferase family 2 protein, partial [Candidatus Firestonebacteria bacterium]
MISVIVINYNGKEHISACLSSLANQTLSKAEYEIIVADNASTDGSKEFVAKKYPGIRLLELDENTGFSKANNIAVEKAAGDWIVFLNNDTEADINWLSELKKASLENPDVSAFASKMLLFDKRDVIDSAGDFLSKYGFGYKRGHGEKDQGQYDRLEKIFGPCGGAGMFKKEVFKALGGFDEDFFAYCEDVDLNFRLKIYGYKACFAYKAVVYHKLGGTFKRESDQHLFLSQRNQEFALFKNAPAKTIVLHWFYNIYSFIKHLFKGKAGVFLKAKFEAVKGRKKFLEKRRWITAKNKFTVKKDELDLLLAKLENNSYRKFFVEPEEAERRTVKALLEKKKLLEALEKKSAELFVKLFLDDSADLVFLGRMYYLFGEKKYID